MPRPAFPKTLREFQSKCATKEACQQYLADCRWPDGFVCPKCANRRAYELASLRRWQRARCRNQVSLSLTAGTILHNTKTRLTVWFWAPYLMTTDKRGLSRIVRLSTIIIGDVATPRKRDLWILEYTIFYDGRPAYSGILGFSRRFCDMRTSEKR